jgi:hypothetical protein
VTDYDQASGLFCSGNHFQTNFTSDWFVIKGREAFQNMGRIGMVFGLMTIIIETDKQQDTSLLDVLNYFSSFV